MRSFLAILSIPLVLARTLELHHRLITPATALTADQSTPEWLPLGSLELSTDLTSSPTRLKPASSSHTKLDLSDKSAKEDGAWYQVGVRGEEGWVYGSTRACFLTTSPRVDIHLTDNHPTSLSISLPAPLSGTCPPIKAAGLTISPLGVTVQLHQSTQIAGDPQLMSASPGKAAAAAPQPIDPNTGLPQAPPPEKTFLQKYWLPLIGISVFIFGQIMAPDAPAQGAAKAK